TLRFQIFERSVLLGRNQLVENEIRLERCAANHIEIARRITGGGTVYMDRSILSWEIVGERTQFGATLADAGQSICEAVARGISRLGVAANFRPQNEIEVGGRRVCGAGGYCEGQTLVYQGTVLVDFDARVMADVLKAPSVSITDKMTSLSSAL